VFVPAGNANSYGWVQVSAHAVVAGRSGNLPTNAINGVIGSSIYVRNVTAFSGGRNGYSVAYATAQDEQTATIKARQQLSMLSNGLHYPCSESHTISTLTWRCQFVTYSLPSYMHVSSVRIIGKNLLVAVMFTPRLVRVELK
jgi:hypothetical protein